MHNQANLSSPLMTKNSENINHLSRAEGTKQLSALDSIVSLALLHPTQDYFPLKTIKRVNAEMFVPCLSVKKI